MLPSPLRHISPSTALDASGRELLFFGGCNYLGLAQHPAVLDAVASNLTTHGLSAGASRTTTGNTTFHAQLEDELADFLGYPAACLLPDGYTANIAAAQALAAMGCASAHLDARAHPSLVDAANAASVRTTTFAHLKPPTNSQAIWTDGVFTADGAIAPLPAHLEHLPSDGVLLVDDCHGFAAIGPAGRGTTAPFAQDPRLVLTTTLAKGLGAAGGIVAGSSELIEHVRTSSAFVCTTPIGPAFAGGSLEALRILRSEPDRIELLAHNANLMREAIRAAGIDLSQASNGSVVPIIGFAPFGDERLRMIRDHLYELGVLAPLIEYPGGEKPLYFRLIVTSEHSHEQIERLGDALRTALEATSSVAT